MNKKLDSYNLRVASLIFILYFYYYFVESKVFSLSTFLSLVSCSSLLLFCLLWKHKPIIIAEIIVPIPPQIKNESAKLNVPLSIHGKYIISLTPWNWNLSYIFPSEPAAVTASPATTKIYQWFLKKNYQWKLQKL